MLSSSIVGPSQPTSIEVDFLDMLEKEEEDFANQIRKQKSFLQNVFREKEELAQLCVNQTAKLSKLESERMEWQRKIIQIEREKRDHLEKLDAVLRKLKRAGLKVNANKSFFCQHELEHLGCWITRDHIQPLPNKVELTQRISQPKNKKAEQERPMVICGHGNSFH